MDTFRALVVDKHGDQLMADILEIESVHLPEGDVTVDVAYSSLNYKDGLVLNGLGGTLGPLVLLVIGASAPPLQAAYGFVALGSLGAALFIIWRMLARRKSAQ